MIQGVGVYSWADGRVYNGDWFQNKMHGKASSSGRTVEDTRETTIMTISMDTESSHGQMAESTMESGSMAASTALESTPQTTARYARVSGQMANVSSGWTAASQTPATIQLRPMEKPKRTEIKRS